jgi:hypothetical protein
MQPLPEVGTHLSCVLDDALLAERLDRGDGGRARERVPRVGQPSGEELRAHPVGDVFPEDHRAEGHVAGVDPLGDGEDVGDDVPVLAREPAAGSPEARHDLVEHEQDPVAVADLANRLEVSLRRGNDAVRPRDRLEDDGRDRLRPFVLQDLLQMRCAGANRARVGMTCGAAVRVRVEHSHHTAHTGLVRPATRIARQRDRAVRCPMVRAIAGDDLVASGVEASELDRVLVRLGAGVREERHGEIAGRDLGEQAPKARARLVRHRRPDRAEPLGLLLDRRDDLRMLVPDVGVDELRREVEIALAVVVPEVAALGARDRDRVDRVLHRPRVEDVLLRIGNDLCSALLDDRHRNAS